jgi:hypothetical protein
MTKRFVLAAVIAAVCATTSMATSHQTSGNDPDAVTKCGVTFDPETQKGVVAVGSGPATIYLDQRALNEDPYLFSTWVYVELNDHLGMQTKAGVPGAIDGSASDSCTTSAHLGMAPDALIF